MSTRNHIFVPVLSAAFLFCIAPVATHAATLDAFDFYGQNGGEATYAATTVDSSLTSSDITRGSGFVPDASTTFTGNGFGFSPTGNPGHLYSTVAASSDQFVTFTVTPTSGNSLSLSSWRVRSGSPIATRIKVPMPCSSTATPKTSTI